MGEGGGEDPPSVDDGAASGTTGGVGVTADETERGRPHRRAPPADDFGWRGWVLVGAILVAFFVIPAAIIVLPRAQGVVADLGLSLRDAYLVLPLPAAILLGAVAVWAALASRRE